jgi:formylmethanofuran dehydrogenase subunit C
MHQSVFRLHLPEWRDSKAVTREVATALSLGTSCIHLTGARGDRLLLADLQGQWAGKIRIDGNVGTEFCRGLDCPNLIVYLDGDTGSGAGLAMRSGTLAISGKAGSLVGSMIRGGQIWCLGPVGARLGHRADGGTIIVGNSIGPMVMDRRRSGIVRIQRFPNETGEAAALQAQIDEIMKWSGHS